MVEEPSSGMLSRQHQLHMPSGTLCLVVLVRTDVSENSGKSTLTQQWNAEDKGDMFSETSILTRATWYKAPYFIIW
jgi:hypothetical protein